MRLERLRSLQRHVRADEQFSQLIVTADICWWFDGKWYIDPENKRDYTGEVDVLNEALNAEEALKKVNSSTAYFPIENYNAILVCDFPSPPQKRTRDKCEGYLERCIVGSNNEYNANYDSLTGLLNSQGYENLLQSQAELIGSDRLLDSGAIESVQRTDALVLVSLDIDHFKQINDSYGHLYGDWVLKALARRLDETCDEINHKFEGRLDARCARPHGEEFFVVVTGTIGAADEAGLGEMVRASVEASVLPNEDELKWLEREHGKPEFAIPGTSKRLVTVSVGISSIGASLEASKRAEAIERMKSQADLALYRAKSAGRNRVCRFADILTEFGRVLEHDPTTNIIAIDIGKNVGVTEGQEFLVRLQKYSGNVPFLFRDGRTEKNLGVYPNVPVGRIVAFNVQREISFCEISDRKIAEPLPSGSLLEAIPAGTIKHHLAKNYAGLASELVVYGNADLQKVVNSYVEAKSDVIAMVFAISDVERVVVDHGVALVNRVLAWLYSKLDVVTKQAAGRVGQIDGMRIAVVGEKKDLVAGKIFDEIRKQALLEFGDIFELRAGVFEKDTCLKSLPHPDLVSLNLSRAIDCAQFAVSSNSAGSYGVKFFTRSVVDEIMGAHRKRRSVQNALRDREEFADIGIIDVQIENQLALCAFESRDYAVAVEAASRAIDLEPENVIVRCNLALSQYALGRFKEAAVEFKQAWGEDGTSILAAYRTALAAAYYRTWREDSTAIAVHDLKMAFQSIGTFPYPHWVGISKVVFDGWTEEVQSI